MSERASPHNPLHIALGLIGAAVGWALSRYAGPLFWVPGVATILLLLLFTRTPLKPRHFIAAITFAGAHAIWFLLASLMLGTWYVFAVDFLLLSAGILWLWVRPGWGGALFLGMVELAMLASNAVSLASEAVGSPSHKTLTVDCSLRLLVLISLVVECRRMRETPEPATVENIS